MYQDTRRLDFHALGREIKRKREAKGWTQEYLAQLVDRTPRSIMYFENRGQHPSLNTFYQIVTLLDISVGIAILMTIASVVIAKCRIVMFYVDQTQMSALFTTTAQIVGGLYGLTLTASSRCWACENSFYI